jgi:penicillin amidase
LGADWPSPWRAIQINKLLRNGSDLVPEDLRRFQTDPGSARADVFVPAFLAAARRTREADQADELLQDAERLLAEWDRRYTKDNTRAVLFELSMNELAWRTWDELHEPQRAPKPPLSAVRLPGSAVLASLLHAIQQARERHGDENAGGWRWDRVRHENIFHLLGLPSLSALELPVQGGPSTINPSSGNGTHGASWRMVVELGEEVRAWSIYPGGQSGNPFSSRYKDRIEKWMNGDLEEVLLPTSSDQFAREWWAVPVLGGIWGTIVRVADRPAFIAAGAAGLGWIVLLAWTTSRGPVAEVADMMGGVVGLPGVVLYVLAILFAAVLAGGAAGVVTAVRGKSVYEGEERRGRVVHEASGGDVEAGTE